MEINRCEYEMRWILVLPVAWLFGTQTVLFFRPSTVISRYLDFGYLE